MVETWMMDEEGRGILCDFYPSKLGAFENE